MHANRHHANKPTKNAAPMYSKSFSHPAPVRCYSHLIASAASALALIATAASISIN